MPHAHVITRRRCLTTLAAASAFYAVPGALAEQLVRTPRQTEGPFYPDKLPLDTDNDLILINDALTPAVGEVTYLSGRILDASGTPVRGALVEIWQVDAKGAYLHTRSGNGDKRDANFQGFGRFLTGSDGRYLFRTIKPVPYPGRTPHIPFAVKSKGAEQFTTQCYVRGEAGNEKDGLLKSITDEKARNSIVVPFTPIKDAPAGELAAHFDIVADFTPKM